MEHKTEAGQKPDSKNPGKLWRWVGRPILSTTIIAGIVGPTVAAAETAHNIDESRQLAAHQHAADQAAGYTRCEALVSKNLKPSSTRVVVRLSGLSSWQQADCGVEADSSNILNSGESLNAQVSDIMVELPSVSRLQEAATHKEMAANRRLNHWEINGSAVYGGMLGFTFGGVITSTIVEFAAKRAQNSDETQPDLRLVGGITEMSPI